MGATHESRKRYPPERRERAVRMVFETIEAEGRSFGVITRIARQLGIGLESLRLWVRQAEVDGGQRPGTTTSDAERIAALERDFRWRWRSGRAGARSPASEPHPELRNHAADGSIAYARSNKAVLRRCLEPAQDLSIRCTERPAQAAAVASVGSRGDSFDNALAESFIGLFKTELVRSRGPFAGQDDLEIATLEWVDWYNHRRLHGQLGTVPPAEYEDRFVADQDHGPCGPVGGGPPRH